MNARLACLSLLVFVTACASPAQTVMPLPSADPLRVYVDAETSQGTAIAAVATAEYYTTQLTATAESRNQIGTQQAMQNQAQATERVWNATATADSIQATSAAAMTASAIAQQAVWTQRAMDITATADSAAVQAFATAQYGMARTEELSLQRKELMNNVAAVTPWILLFATFAALILFLKRWTRVRIIQRDTRGDAPLLLDVVDGVTYDADRSPSAAAGLQRVDLNRLPQFSANDHTHTAARDQAIDLAMRSHGKGNRRPFPSAPAQPGEIPMPPIETIEPNTARPLFRDVIPHILQDAIDAEVISEEQP